MKRTLGDWSIDHPILSTILFFPVCLVMLAVALVVGAIMLAPMMHGAIFWPFWDDKHRGKTGA